jgi:hypothetical protein
MRVPVACACVSRSRRREGRPVLDCVGPNEVRTEQPWGVSAGTSPFLSSFSIRGWCAGPSSGDRAPSPAASAARRGVTRGCRVSVRPGPRRSPIGCNRPCGRRGCVPHAVARAVMLAGRERLRPDAQESGPPSGARREPPRHGPAGVLLSKNAPGQEVRVRIGTGGEHPPAVSEESPGGGGRHLRISWCRPLRFGGGPVGPRPDPPATGTRAARAPRPPPGRRRVLLPARPPGR